MESNLKTKTALSVFPAEIWNMILQNVTSPSTIFNMCLTSDDLANMLESSRQVWMFGLVFPHLFDYLDHQNVLRCRTACKTWLKETNNFLQNHPSHHIDADKIPEAKKPSLTKFFGNKSLWFECRPIPKKMCAWKFSEEMNDHCRNPFPSRSVSLLSSDRQFGFGYGTFLERFGKHIWYLEVNFPGEHIHPLRFLEDIYKTLSYTPNLRKFSMLNMEMPYRPWKHENDFKSTFSGYMNFLRTRPLPNLPSLETLEIGSESVHYKYYSTPFIDTIVCAYANTLQRIAMDTDPIVFSVPLPNLVDFRFYNRDTKFGLTNFSRLRSPLKKLHVVTRMDGEGTIFTPIFQKIQRFHATLTSLIVQLPHDGGQMQLIHMPNLEYLELIHGADLKFSAYSKFVYNFSKSLKHFEILANGKLFDTHTCHWEDTYITLRSIPGCEENGIVDPYKSELWVKLPLLQIFTFCGSRSSDSKRIFMRQSYDYFHNISVKKVNM